VSSALRDRFDPEHVRARELAAAKIGELLDPDDAAWLETHLAWCAPCRAVAGEYESQRLELRALRLNEPQPPRDLWARTAAALEAEQTRKGIRTERAAPRTTPAIRGRTSFPLGALTGAVAAVFVIGVTILSGRDVPTIVQPDATQPTSAAGTPALGTPFPVPPRNVAVFLTGGSRLEYSNVSVDRVCPVDIDPRCATTQLGSRYQVAVPVGPKVADAISNGTKSHVVLVHDAGNVVVVPVIPRPSQPPSTATAPPSAEPVETTQPSDAASDAPPATATPDPSISPEATPSEDPSPTTSAEPTPSEAPSEAPSSEQPSEAPASLEVTAPPDDGPIVIAADVIVVGRSAAYSPTGEAFAFTARPTDGSLGPDVYLWRVGTDLAVPITADHQSIFSGWVGDRLLISRSNPDGDPLVAARGDVPMSLLLDPATGEETLITPDPMFRPTVDPTGRLAVWWDGAIEPGADGFGWQPRSGRLLLGDWVDPAGGEPDGAAREEDVLASGPVPDWDARWDDTGTRLAVWIADRDDPGTGKLSLYGIDTASGRLDTEQPLLKDEPALPGFSIDNGQLVWAAASADGERRVEVLAWNGRDVGKVELAPEQELIIVR
jgi:hypothetical protein